MADLISVSEKIETVDALAKFAADQVCS